MKKLNVLFCLLLKIAFKLCLKRSIKYLKIDLYQPHEYNTGTPTATEPLPIAEFHRPVDYVSLSSVCINGMYCFWIFRVVRLIVMLRCGRASDLIVMGRASDTDTDCPLDRP